MPFELGLAVAISDGESRRRHEWRILEAEPFRINESLSDVNGYEVFVHRGSVEGLIEALTDVFSRSLGSAPLRTEGDLLRLYRKLRGYRRDRIRGSVFRPASFANLVVAATVYRDLVASEHSDR